MNSFRPATLLVLVAWAGLLLQNLSLRAQSAPDAWVLPITANGPILSSPAVSPGDFTVYIGDNAGYLTAVDPNLGAMGPNIASRPVKKWTYNTGRAFYYSSPTIGTNGIIYAASSSLFALDPSGNLRWFFPFPGGVGASSNSSPALGIDGTIYVASVDSTLYAIRDLGNAPTNIWKFSTVTNEFRNMIASSPSVGADGSIYFVTEQDIMYAVAANGREKWRRILNDNGSNAQGELASSPAIGRDGTIYVGTKGSGLLALKDNGNTSIVKWAFDPGDDVWFVSSPSVGAAETVYISSIDGRFYGLRTSQTNATLLAGFPKPLGVVVRSSAAIDRFGNAYVGTLAGTFRGIKPDGQDLPLPFPFGPMGSISSSPTIVSDGLKAVALFGSTDFNLYAAFVPAPLAPLSTAAWPMFRKDQSHSGVGSTAAPSIIRHPDHVNANVGARVTFTVEAIGIPAPIYQWQKSGIPIPLARNATATSPTLIIPSANPSDAGIGVDGYDCVVSNSDGSITTRKASLTLSSAPEILIDPSVRLSALEDSRSDPIRFFVFDLETPTANLGFRATSSNPAIIPNTGFEYGFGAGDGSVRTLRVLPATNQFGTVVITAYVRDADGLEVSTDVTLRIDPINDPPTFDPLPNISMDENSVRTVLVTNISSGPLNESDQRIRVIATSDNPAIIPHPVLSRDLLETNVNFTTLTIVPAPGANGTANITVTIQDTPAAATFVPGFSLSTSRTFSVTIGAVNDPPLILLSNPSFAGSEDTALLLGGVRVSDPDAGAGQLRLSLTATNGFVAFGDTSGLVFLNGTVNRLTNIVVSGTLASLNSALSTLNYLGFRDTFGVDRLTITVDDQGNTGTGGPKQDSKTINLNIAAVNDPPNIDRVNAQTLGANATLNVRVKVTDVDSPSASLSLVATSSDLNIIAPPLVFRDPADPAFWVVQLTSAGLLQTTSISLLASDGVANSTTSFVVTVQTTNVLPVFTGLPSVVVLPEDTQTNLSFTVGDVETPASGLNLQVFSSNPVLLPASSLTLGGSGSARSLLVAPATNQFGSASLSVVLSDGASSVTNRIDFNVTPVNDIPIISTIHDVTVPLAITTNASFTVQDVETPPAALGIAVSSSVPTIIANNPLIGIDGTNRSIRLFPLGVPGTSEMTVVVTDENGGTATNRFRVTVIDPLPVITQQPTNVLAVSGSTAIFTVVATGQPPLSYQWKFRGVDLGGATNSVLTLPGVTASLAGAYSVSVSNVFGGKLSNPAELSVITPPIFIVHPESQSIRAGATVNLFGNAAGSQPIAYQWLFDGTPIPRATNNTLTLVGVTAAQQGRYSLRANNPAGTASSREATVTVNVNTPPTITDILNPSPILEGSVAGPFTFTVLDNETPIGLIVTAQSSNPTLLPDSAITIGGGTGPFRNIVMRPLAGQTGTATITVTVRDPDGATSSDTLVLTVTRANTPPSIQDIQDRQTEVNTKTPAIVFNIRDAETPALDLRLSRASSNPALVPDSNIVFGGSGSFRTVQIEPVPNQTGVATITITVSDGELSSSDSFVLTVVRPVVPPSILRQPSSTITTNVGANVLLSVEASGSDPLAYQWRFNTNPIPSATSSNLVLTNVQVAQSGRYSVVVSNPGGSISSAETLLTVVAENMPPSVSLLQPTNNAAFTAGEPIILTATANDPDGLVTKVAFFSGSTLVGEDASSPYNAIATNLPPGSYSITAVATDNEGLTTISTPATIRIEQPKNLPAISITDSGGLEGNSGFKNFTFNLTLSALSEVPVTVQYSTFGDTAAAVSDFVESRGEVRFELGQRTKTIVVQVIGDTVPDGDNETFFVNLSSPENAILADSQGIGTIQDDEDPVFISVSDASVTEGNLGTNSLAFVVLLSDPSPQEVSVEFNTVNGTALAGKDFVARAGRLVFPARTTRLEILVPVIPDLVQEPNKQLTLRLSNPANAILFPGEEEGLGTITDDDAPPVARVEDLALPEGNAGATEARVVVTLTSPSAQRVTMNYTTVDGTAKTSDSDYSTSSGEINFEPGVTSQTIAIPITADTINEPDENFLFRLSNPSGTTISRAEATITIRNDDVPPTLSVVGRNIIEGNTGSANVEVTVLLSTPSGQVVTVDYGTRDLTALAGLDYSRTAGTLVFQPGETTKLVPLSVLGDLIDESRETFELILERAVNAEINEGVAIVAILDDDQAPSLTIVDASVQEGNSGTTEAVFNVSLSAASGQTVSVAFETLNLTAKSGEDYIAANGNLSFAPGQINKTVSIPVLGDIVNEPNEQFSVKLAAPANATLARDTGLGTIVNDDDAPKLRIEDVEVDEGNAGLLPASVSVRLTSGSSQRVTVRYASASGSATSGEDFLSASGEIVFDPGETSKAVTLQVVGDTSDEPNETLSIKLLNSVNADIDRAEAVVTLLDDDLAPTLSIIGRNVLEGNSGTTNAVFTILLSTPSGQIVKVDYTSSDITATSNVDYTPGKGELVFLPGETTKTIPIPVIGDLVDEPRETFQIKLSSPSGATINEDTAVGAILDDDVAPTLTVTDASITEGQAGQTTLSLTVSLSNPSGQTVTVLYATADASAQANADYLTVNGQLTFNPGQASLQIPIAILTDRVHEETETFTLSISSPVNATIARAQALVTILDDDDVPTLPPNLAPIPDQSSPMNGSVSVSINVLDPDTPIQQVTVSATSDNPELLTPDGIRLTGDTESRTLLLTPRPDRTGLALVTVNANDGRHTAARTFRLSVSTPNTPPTIISQPQSRVVLVGTSVSFSVSASGSPPLRYQWRLNGVNIPQGTSAVLSLDAVQSSQSGEYMVTISNDAGSVTSEKATLVVGRLGAKLWDFNVGKPIRTSVALGKDSTLYFGADDRKVYALRSDGTFIWSFTTGGELYSSPAIASDGTVYIGSFDGKLYAIDSAGSKKWEFTTGAEIYSTPAISKSGDVYFGSYDSKVYALSPNGTKKWEFTTGNTIASSASIGADGTIYIGSQDRKLYALNPDGTKKWDFTTGADVISSPTIGEDGTIYFGSLDKRLYALNPDGTQRWAFTAANAIRSSPSIGQDGTLYFGTDDGRLYAVDSTGRRKWDISTGLLIFSSPAVGADGTIYVGSFDKKLYAFNPNGTRRWEFATEGEVYSSPALDKEGVVYLGSLDGRLYAIKGTTGLAETPWPMFRRLPDHSGRVPDGNTPAAPRLGMPEFRAGSGLFIAFNSNAGVTYQLEVSEDLVVWTAVKTLTATGAASEFSHNPPPGPTVRFYRIAAKP